MDDDFRECVSNQLVIDQRRLDGRWVTRKTTVTNGQGHYAVDMSDRQGRYRALAPRIEVADPGDESVHVYSRVVKEKKHIHS